MTRPDSPCIAICDTNATKPEIGNRCIKVVGEIAYIPLTKCREAIIDASDAELLGGWKWTYGNKYVYRGVKSKEKERRIYLHRFLMGEPDGLHVDHVNGNGLDNRRTNLRVVTRSQNMCNQKISRKNTSGYKGVSWNKNAKKWQSYISIQLKRTHLGYFTSPELAHQAYIDASANIHGDYGRLA